MNRKIVSEHNKNKSEMVQPKTHIEQIECPKCKTIQNATVEHLPPFWSYVHHCEKCKYVIMESEWQKVTDKTPTKMTTEERMIEAVSSAIITGYENTTKDIHKAAKAYSDIASQQVIKGKIEVLEAVLSDLCPDSNYVIQNKLTQLKTQLENEQD